MFFNWNGQFMDSGATGKVRVDTAGRSGCSLIETMLWRNGTVRYWAAHFRRLRESAAQLQLPVTDLSGSRLLSLFAKLVQINKVTDTCVLRLQVFAVDQKPGYGFLIECKQPAWLSSGFPPAPRSVGIAEGVIKSYDAYAALKSGARRVYEVAGRQARSRGWYDALLLNQYGRIVESTISNVFWAEGGKLFTPPLREGCVAGVLRHQLLHTPQLSVTERPLTPSLLREADELFLTNAVRGIQPIHHFEEKEYATGLTRSIRLPGLSA